MIKNNNIKFKELVWDSKKLNKKVYSIEFKKNLKENEMHHLLNSCKKGLYYFKNPTNLRKNSNKIALKTNATLYDTNILFQSKKIKSKFDSNENFKYTENKYINLNYDKLNFKFSRFYKDNKLKDEMGSVYKDWISNSINKKNKSFLVCKKGDKEVAFLLYKLIRNDYIIELLFVRKEYQKLGIGTNLIELLRENANKNKINNIYVGTQVSNIRAINFYIKNGFIVKKTIDIYHWWK